VSAAGSQVDVSAIVDQDADTPGSVYVYTETLDTAPETTTTVRVLRGDSEQSIRKQIGVVLYSDRLGDDATIYREGDAVPKGEENQHGFADLKAQNTTIRTFTESDGSVSVKTNNDASRLERVLYGLRVQFPNVPIAIPTPTLHGIVPMIPGSGPIGVFGSFEGVIG
jgi:hypothetical protein